MVPIRIDTRLGGLDYPVATFTILGYHGITGQVINLEDPEIQYCLIHSIAQR